MHLLRLFQHLSIISRTMESDSSPYHLCLSSNALPKSNQYIIELMCFAIIE